MKLKLVVALILIMVLVISYVTNAMLFSLGGILSQILWNGGEDGTDGIHSGDCECGCVWVAGDSSQNISTTITTNGLDDLELLGNYRISLYTDNRENNSGGAEPTAGITAAVSENTMKNLEVELGDWIYIENIGVRQIQDIIETDSVIGVCTDQDDSDIADYNGTSLKIWIVEENGDIQQGSQEGVEPPKVSNNTVTIPGYGPSTGSLEDTSSINGNQLPVLTGDRKIVTDRILPAAVAVEQYYHIRVLLSLCHAPKEAGWNNRGRYTNPVGNHDYNLYGITLGGGDFLEVPHKNEARYHTYQHGSTKFRSYDSFTESVVDHGRLLASGSSYKVVAAAYNQGWEAQALALAETPYLGNDNNVSESELQQVRKDYADRITSFVSGGTGDWSAFDNLAVCMKYLSENNLMDEYYAAVELITGTSYYTEGIVSNPGTISGVNVGNSSNGHWVCNCNRPCPYCKCHDGDNGGNGFASNVGQWEFAPAVEGQTSGLWGTRDDFAKWIEALDNTNAPLDANINQLKINMRAILPLVGIDTIKPYTYAVDKFTGPDGRGFIHYGQNGSSGEPYLKYHHNDGTGSGSTFEASACGVYSVAMCLSTLEKKIINPAEVAIAMQTYGVRNNKRINTTLMGSSGAAYWSGMLAVIQEAGYTNSKLSGQRITQSEVDKCLAEGGLVILVTTDREFTNSSHYIVIREKAESGNYLLGNSTRTNNNEYSFEKLASKAKTNALYIYPKANSGINNMNGSSNSQTSSSSSTSVRVNIVQDAKELLGIPYKWGGTTIKGFDCSGLVQYVYSNNGYKELPRTAKSQFRATRRVSMEELREGDLVFFATLEEGVVGHVGIYIGGNEFIHAPNTGDVVKISRFDGYWSEVFLGGGVVIND